MTYQEAAQSALQCQDACNLSGVVFSFSDAMQAICDEQHRLGEGSTWKNAHPIVTLYLCKLCDLNGVAYAWDEHAYERVKVMAQGMGVQS